MGFPKAVVGKGNFPGNDSETPPTFRTWQSYAEGTFEKAERRKLQRCQEQAIPMSTELGAGSHPGGWVGVRLRARR